MSFQPLPHVSVVSANASDVLALLAFVQHRSNCGWLGIMDDKAPCNCGLKKLLTQLQLPMLDVLRNVSVHAREIIDDDLMKGLRP